MTSSYESRHCAMCKYLSPEEGLLFFTVAIITEVYLRQYIPYFDTTQLLQVKKGQYVEIRFHMYRSSYPPGAPCEDEEYLEIRDGYNQSANLLGVFCGWYVPNVIRRSSGHNMWLKFSPQRRYSFFLDSYEGKALDKTGR